MWRLYQVSSVSRPQNQAESASQRVEYSEPEQLDRILEHLRRVREQAEAAKAEPTAFDTGPAVGAVEEPVATTAAPGVTPASAKNAAEIAAAKPAAEPIPAPTAAAGPDPALRHMPDSAREKLSAFVAGKAAPKPLGNATAAADAVKAKTKPELVTRSSELRQALMASRDAFIATGIFSLVINVLMLAGPLFMLQVYDRVMTSGSIPTLVALSVLTAGVYAIIGLLELVRSRITVRVGVELDRRIGDRVFQASLKKSLLQPGSSLLALRELDSLRQFIGGSGPLTFFDAPWTPIYLLVIFLTHWTLGVAATLGAATLLVTAWASETRSRQPLAEAGKAAGRSIELAETGQRNAESITAMGMLSAYRGRWQKANVESLAWQMLASDRLGSLTAVSKTLRLLLQSMMLAIGAALAIKGEISAGSIIAGTIIFGRALAPVEQAVGQWKAFIKARESFAKLEGLLAQYPRPAERMTLPKPKGHLEVANLRVAAPESKTVILSNIHFALKPGQMVAVIGPSASGKSTLARAIVGLWEPFGGTIRLDGARLDQWNPEELGQHIGYLPQNVELFAGSVRENISRFRPDATDDDVVNAAKAAHAHELIMALPQSYETQLGAFGAYLSAGQRQRIGLARALYSNPPLVVLDEPNANLDRSGDEALASAIDGMRARGQAVVLVSHRVQAIGKADCLLYIEKGAQRAFGPRAEVIKFLQSGGLNGDQPMPSVAQATPQQATATQQMPAQQASPVSATKVAPAARAPVAGSATPPVAPATLGAPATAVPAAIAPAAPSAPNPALPAPSTQA